MLRSRRVRLLTGFVAGLTVPGAPLATATSVDFALTYVDRDYGGTGKPGWVRAGDMDGDGDADVVAGGGRVLYVYENDGTGAGWQRHGSLDATAEIGANAAVLIDVDADGDLDVVSARYYAEIGWWENPGGRLQTRPWPFHAITGSHGAFGRIANVLTGKPRSWFLHDLVAADLDADGDAGELVANLISSGMDGELRVLWLRRPPTVGEDWQVNVIEAGRHGTGNNHAGIDVGDIDGDGRLDLSYSNGWYRAGATPDARWSWHELTDVVGVSCSLLRDLDGDGDLDIVVSAGHHASGVYWLENRRAAGDGWRLHTIDASIRNPECLAVFDLDGDGDLDVVTCDLDFSRWNEPVHGVYWIEHASGADHVWVTRSLATDVFPSHLLQAVDVDGDGLTDLISEAAGHSVVSYYRNMSIRGSR